MARRYRVLLVLLPEDEKDYSISAERDRLDIRGPASVGYMHGVFSRAGLRKGLRERLRASREWS